MLSLSVTVQIKRNRYLYSLRLYPITALFSCQLRPTLFCHILFLILAADTDKKRECHMSQQALPRGLALCFPAASPGLCLRAVSDSCKGRLKTPVLTLRPLQR